MRLLFRQMCSCDGAINLPKPRFKIAKPPDMDAPNPELYISLDLLCPKCDTPWESYAGLKSPVKKPKLILPS